MLWASGWQLLIYLPLKGVQCVLWDCSLGWAEAWYMGPTWRFISKEHYQPQKTILLSHTLSDFWELHQHKCTFSIDLIIIPSGKISFMSSFKNLIYYLPEGLYTPYQPNLSPPHLILSIFFLQILFSLLGNDFTCATVWNALLNSEQMTSTACFVQKIIISKRDTSLVWHIYSASYPASYFHSSL